jgi:TatA/E family protein of Tat protein translocase
MFGTLGGPELVLILVLALIIFGPRKLPDIGKSLGRMMLEFRKASNEFRRTIEEEVEAEKPRPQEPQLPPPAPLDVPSAPPNAGEPHGEQAVPAGMSPETPPGPPTDPTVNREVAATAADPK